MLMDAELAERNRRAELAEDAFADIYRGWRLCSS